MTALRLQNAGLADGRTVDVLLRGTRIEAVETAGQFAMSAADNAYDVRGQLLTPGLTDPHLHPDKAFGLEEDDGSAVSLVEAIRRVRAQKPHQTATMIEARTIRLVDWCLQFGATRARVHAEVDPLLGLRSVEGVLAARDAVAHRFHLEVVAFPQEGIIDEPGTLALLEQAMRLGCDVVGAISYQDADTRAHLESAARLARQFDAPLDIHADFGMPVERSALALIADVSDAFGLTGRITLGHCTTLALMDDEQLERTLARLVETAMKVVCLPRTDLYLDGRVAPLDRLWSAGVPAFVGTNNV
ncbi:MAG TPA: amidohydrolase family protein, partial [Chloroflexota bacterium]|nr:amidohydrolase family protein [Chloroflexota bacterium]